MATETPAKQGSWVAFANGIEPLANECPDFGVFLVVKKPFWRRSHHRSNQPLPVARVEVSESTWDLCIHAPGLIKENAVSAGAIEMVEFYTQLSAHSETSPHCTLVASDERDISRADIAMLFGGKGEWTGQPLEEVEDEDLLARLDLPVLEITIEVLPASNSIHLCLKV